MSLLVQSLLEQARRFAEQKDQRAEKAFELVLENDPFNVEARVFLARVDMQKGRYRDALEHLLIATRIKPDNAALWRSLGLAYIALDQHDDAENALRRCLKLAPRMHVARLHLGKVLEEKNEHGKATQTYLRVLSEAQRDGLWLDAKTTPAWLVADIRHAIEAANRGRVEIYEALMQPLFQRFGSAELRRVDSAVHGILGTKSVQTPPGQKPTFMYFPDIPSTPVFSRELFPWFDLLEQSHESIRAEAESILQHQNGLSPFLQFDEGSKVSDYLGGQQPQWDACFFYRHGTAYPDNLQACPQTARVLEQLPLVHIDGHAPEICFSVLAPDTHILPHYGTSNIRAVVHLPLIVPENCALKVLDQTLPGRAGHCLAFDDTFLHEAWNRSKHTRVILLMDAWNPHLTEVEKLALSDVISRVGDFGKDVVVH
jgi:aspartate beta-hydroxylase